MGASHTGTAAEGREGILQYTIRPEIGGVDFRQRRLPEQLADRLAGKVGAELMLFASRMREGLLAASVAIGLEVMGELMEAEVTEVAGPKGRHRKQQRTAYRHGDEAGAVVLGGRKVPVRRPRARGVEGGEVHLDSYDTFTSLDLLTEHTVAAMLAGLSTRRYPVGLEPVGSKVEADARSTSRSAVSRRFVAATGARLNQFRSRDLSGQRFLVVFADGFDFAGQTMVGALGVTAGGTKVPLGVVQGSTENAVVVRGLISGLRDRGLNGEGGILFVLDGGKALHRAVQDVYGAQAVIQRCRLHKERNVLEHVPEAERGWALAQMRRAWKNPDADEAARGLRTLAGRLDEVNPDAAGSLREGLDEMFTVTRLGLSGPLLKSLYSTNCVESMVDIVRQRCRNVKRWQRGDMRLRWAAAGMLAAEGQFRRVRGYRQLPQLAAILARVTADGEAQLQASA